MNQSAEYKKGLTAFLSGFLTSQRLERFQSVLALRTRYVTVALEDIYQPHNASAVLRTCDCMGVQDVHIIENNNQYQVNPDVALGASQWLTLRKYNDGDLNTAACYDRLRTEGYRIVATTPHEADVKVDDLDLEKGKLALVFGTELRGLTSLALENADEFVKLPMYGFTESYNISVSAALFLYSLTGRLRRSSIDWGLTVEERDDVMLNWIKSSLRKPDMLEREFARKFYGERERDFS